MSKREWASDLECLIFSDMVYEDFYDEVDGDLNKNLKKIFLIGNNNRFYNPDNNSLRLERFEEYCKQMEQLGIMEKWQFMAQEGENGHKAHFGDKERKFMDYLNNEEEYKLTVDEDLNITFVPKTQRVATDFAVTDLPDKLRSFVDHVADNPQPIGILLTLLYPFILEFDLSVQTDENGEMLKKSVKELLDEDIGNDGFVIENKENKAFYAVAFRNEADKEILIAYRGTDQTYPDHLMNNALIAAGIPSEHFEMAEKFYQSIKQQLKTVYHEDPKDYKFTFTGHSLGGGLAQYAATMAEDEVDYQCITWNGIGVEDFRNFSGNEFLGYKCGMLHFLGDMMEINDIMDSIKKGLISNDILEEVQVGQDTIITLSDDVIEKDGEIGELTKANTRSSIYSVLFGEESNQGISKEIGNWNFKFRLGDSDLSHYEKEKRTEAIGQKIDKLIEENISWGLAKRKKKFIDKYIKYINNGDEKILTYSNSHDVTGTILNHVGDCILVDRFDDSGGFINRDNGINSKTLDNFIEKIEEDKLRLAIQHSFDLFYPQILLEKRANGANPLNRFNQKAKAGDLTTNLSYNYLASIVKAIIVDIITDKVDEDILYLKGMGELAEIYKDNKKKGNKEMIRVLIAALVHSMILFKRELGSKLKADLLSEEYQSQIVLADNNNTHQVTKIAIRFDKEEKFDYILTEEARQYKLDRVILKQLNKMNEDELSKLWSWKKINEDKAVLILGEEGVSEDNRINYHIKVSEPEITNEEYQLEISLEAMREGKLSNAADIIQLDNNKDTENEKSYRVRPSPSNMDIYDNEDVINIFKLEFKF